MSVKKNKKKKQQFLKATTFREKCKKIEFHLQGSLTKNPSASLKSMLESDKRPDKGKYPKQFFMTQIRKIS